MSRTYLAVLASALVLTACQGEVTPEPSVPPTTAPTVSSSPPTASPTQTPTLSPEEEAAMQAVVDFWAMRDELASDPEVGLTRLSEVARGQALEVHRSSLVAHAGQGLRQVGSVTVTPTAVTTGDAAGLYEVTACIDVSGVNVVDVDGKSAVPPGRPDMSEYDYTVERDGEQWFVVEDLLESKDC